MAVLKEFKEIIDLLPEPDYRLYGSNITEASAREVMDNPLYAFTVNRRANYVIGIFRTLFILVKRGEKFHLMVTNYNRESNTFTDYITIDAPPEGKKLQKSDWPFSIDDIGLRLDSTCYDKNIIYFGTLVDDAKTIREALKARREKKVLTLEPVVV